jgi:hypothetical protein
MMMKTLKYIGVVMGLFFSTSLFAGGFMGKHFVLDVNAGIAPSNIAPHDNGSHEDIGLMSGFFDYRCVPSADLECIVWRKGSLMVDFHYQSSVSFVEDANVWSEDGSSSVTAADISYCDLQLAYRQYIFSSSNAPYGRYLQVGCGHVVTDCDMEHTTYSKRDKTERDGSCDFNVVSAEIGYNHLFFNNHIRLSFAVRAVHRLGKDESDDKINSQWYYDNANQYSLKAGIGYVLF